MESKLIKLKKWLDADAGFDIGHKRRKEVDVYFRTLFYMLALILEPYENLEVIADIVNRDHSTVVHARKKLFNKVIKKKRFNKLLIEYKLKFLKEKSEENLTAEAKLYLLQEKYDDAMHKIVVIEKLIEKKALLTEIEVRYRELNPIQQQTYNERADLILKSFSWKKYNSTFEKTHVGLNSN